MGRTSDSRERLLDAALELIWSSSYASISVDQICERAGVKKGSFYHFFPSKEDLTIEAYEHHWQTEIQPQVEALFAVSVPALDRLAGWCRAIYEDQRAKFEELGHVPGCPICSIGTEASSQSERLRRKAEELLDRGEFHVERAIRDAQQAGLLPPGDPRTKALTMRTLVFGAMLQAKLHNDPELLRDLDRQVFDLLGVQLPV